MGRSTVFIVGDRRVNAWGQDVTAGADEDADLTYSSWTAKQLMAEIEKRNEDREDDDRIVLEGKKKSDAVTALEADDAAAEEE